MNNDCQVNYNYPDSFGTLTLMDIDFLYKFHPIEICLTCIRTVIRLGDEIKIVTFCPYAIVIPAPIVAMVYAKATIREKKRLVFLHIPQKSIFQLLNV
jgi:hypothetical protein